MILWPAARREAVREVPRPGEEPPAIAMWSISNVLSGFEERNLVIEAGLAIGFNQV